MANHVTNIIKIEADTDERIDEVMLSILDDQGMIDFNEIIPMPKILRSTSSPNSDNAIECIEKTGYECWYTWAKSNWGTRSNAYGREVSYKRVHFARWHRTAFSSKLLVHKVRFYAKRIDKKRFKQYCAEHGVPKEARFKTAWTCPVEIFKNISLRFPDVKVIVKFADEDLGSNCGWFVCQQGSVIHSLISAPYSEMNEAQRRKWRKYAFNIYHPNTDPKNHFLDENWDYIEE